MVFHFTNHPKSIIEQRKWFFYYINGQQNYHVTTCTIIIYFFAHLWILILRQNFDARVDIGTTVDQNVAQNRSKLDLNWAILKWLKIFLARKKISIFDKHFGGLFFLEKCLFTWKISFSNMMRFLKLIK